MKGSRVLLVVSGLAVACGVVLFPAPTGRDGSKPRLAIVRQTREQGRQVVFFRLEGARGRRISFTGLKALKLADRLRPILLDDVEMTVVGDGGGRAIDTGPVGYTPIFSPPAQLWTPSRRFAMFDPTTARNEFGVFAPTNASVWRLQVGLQYEPTLLERFRSKLDAWKAYWQMRLFPRATPTTQIVWINSGRRVGGFGVPVESDLIVNRSDEP